MFNAIHGSPGEDGFMQGYFELLNMPHTSCGMYQASLTFNKRDCIKRLKPYGIKTAESYYLNLEILLMKTLIVNQSRFTMFCKS